MRYVKNTKILIAIWLVLVLLFVFNFGLIYTVAKLDMGSPKLRQDRRDVGLETFDDGGIKQIATKLEGMGGSLDIYNSKEEYADTVAKSVGTDIGEFAFKQSRFTPVMQKITVMSVSSGSDANQNYIPSTPIKNAMVRVDGVPRYTDAYGTLTLQIDKEYVELYVEKNGYNPHIEMLFVTGLDKTIYLKQPSDDLEIYSVYMYQAGVGQYVDKQLLSVSNEETENAVITLDANVVPDKIFFAKNGVEQEYKNNFEYSFLNCEDTAVFGIAFEYNGVRSKELPLKIKVFSQVEIDMTAFENLGWGVDLEAENPPVATRDNNFFGDSIDIDLGPIFDLLFTNKSGTGNFDYAYDRIENKIDIVLGYEFADSLGDKAKWNQGKREEFDRIDDYFSKTSPNRGADNNLARFDEYVRTMKELKMSQKDLTTPLGGGLKPNFSVKFSIGGKITIYLSDTNIPKNADIVIFGAANFEVEFGGMFVIGFIPGYWEAGLGFELELNAGFKDFLTDYFVFSVGLTVEIWAKIGAGVGFEEILSAGIYGKLGFSNDFSFVVGPGKDPDEPGFSHDSMQLTLGIYYKVAALFINLEGPIYEHSWEFVDREENLNKLYDNRQQSYVLNRTNQNKKLLQQAVAFDDDIDDTFISNIYQNAAPQMVKLQDDRILMVWQTDDTTRSSANRTKLVYSIFDRGVWSAVKDVHSDNTADFYHKLEIDDNNQVYLAWQSSKSLAPDITDISEIDKVAKLGEISIARFDTVTDKFEQKTTLTDNEYMDTNPSFAVRQRLSDPITVVWQANDESDMFGESGISSVWYSSLVSGVWSKPVQIKSTSNKLLEYSAGYNGGELYVATLINNDSQDKYSNENSLWVKSQSGVENIVGKNTFYKSSPNFANTNGQVNLYWYDSDGVNVCSNYDSPKNTYRLIDNSDRVGRNFEIQSNGDGLIFSYIDTETGFRQLKASVLSLADFQWSHNIVLTSGEHNAIGYSVVSTIDGFKVSSVAERQTEFGSYYDLVVGDVEFEPAVSIDDAYFYSQSDLDNKFNVYVDITNIGNVALSQIKFVAGSLQGMHNFDPKFFAGSSDTIIISMPSNQMPNVSEKIAIYYTDSDGIDILLDSCELNTQVVYYQMSVDSMGITGNQSFIINVINRGLTSTDYSVVVRRADTDQIIETLDSSRFVDDICEYKIDYSKISLPKNTEIIFEIKTVVHNEYEVGTVVNMIAEGDLYNNDIEFISGEILDAWNNAKSMLV